MINSNDKMHHNSVICPGVSSIRQIDVLLEIVTCPDGMKESGKNVTKLSPSEFF